MSAKLLSQPFSPNIEEINGRKFIVNKYEKIYNLCKVHNYEKNDVIQVDKDNKRITLDHHRNDSAKRLNKNLRKQFNYDDLILNDEKINEKLLNTFVKRILMKHENFVVICINKGSQKVSNKYNEESLSQLMRELYGQIDELISSDISLRLSSVEINESNDEVIDLCESIEKNESENGNGSSSDQFKKHRINNLEAALNILNKIHKTEPENSGRNHRIFTVNIYQRISPQQSMTNSNSKVQCSSITWLQMNLSKQRSKRIPVTTSSNCHSNTFHRSRCVSLSSMSRYFTGSLSRIHSNSQITTENDRDDNNNTNLHQLLNTIFFDQYAQSNFFCFLTHLSICNNEKISDSLQLLQFSGKISRLKDRLRTYKVPIEDDNEIYPQPFNSSSTNTTIRRGNTTTTTTQFHSSELWKYVRDGKRRKSVVSNKMNDNDNSADNDDTNLVTTSLSELSCVETVVFNGDENVTFKRAGLSDDESHISRKIRASFNASDSDSGCKDVRRKLLKSRSNYSSSNQKSLVWSKSALKKAHKAIMKGEETWVDGPDIPKAVEVNMEKPAATHSNRYHDYKDPQVPNYQGNYFDQISPLPISSSPCQPSLTQIPELANINTQSSTHNLNNIFFNDNTNIDHIIDNDEQNQTTLTRWFNDVTRLTSSPSANSNIPYAQCCPGYVPETARPPSNGYGDDTFHGYHYYDANNSNNNTASSNSITHPSHNNNNMNLRNNNCYGDDNFYGYQYYDLVNGHVSSKPNPQKAYHNQAQLSYSHYGSHTRNGFYQQPSSASANNFQSFRNPQQAPPQYHSLTRTRTANKSTDNHKNTPESNDKPITKSKSFLSRGPLDLIKRTLLKGKSSKKPSSLSTCTSANKPSDSQSLSPVEPRVVSHVSNTSELISNSQHQALHYLQPIQQHQALSSSIGLITAHNNDEFEDDDDDDDSTEESSSESECNEWFRNIKTFKSSCPPSKYSPCPPSTTNSPISTTNIRPPSAPLPSFKQLHLQNQHHQQNLIHRNSQQYRHQPNQQKSNTVNSRQRSNSSGYGSVAGNGVISGNNHPSNNHNNNGSFGSGTDHLSSEFSSLTNESDELRPQHQNRYFNAHNTQINTSNSSSYEHLDPDMIAEKCEALVKQEKAFLLIRNQELMISDFLNSTKKHLTQEHMKIQLTASVIDYSRLGTDPFYLDELEEDTNVIRDTIAFYKSRLHFESSFVTPSPSMSNRNAINDHHMVNSAQPTPKLYY